MIKNKADKDFYYFIKIDSCIISFISQSIHPIIVIIMINNAQFVDLSREIGQKTGSEDWIRGKILGSSNRSSWASNFQPWSAFVLFLTRFTFFSPSMLAFMIFPYSSMNLGRSDLLTTVDNFLVFAFIRTRQKCSFGSGCGGRPSRGFGLSMPLSKNCEVNCWIKTRIAGRWKWEKLTLFESDGECTLISYLLREYCDLREKLWTCSSELSVNRACATMTYLIII